MIEADSSTATSTLGAGGALLLLAGGVVLGLPGWLAYAGKWQRWTTGSYGSAFPYFPFGLAWIGAAAVLAGLAALLAAIGHTAAVIAYLVLGVPAVVMFCCGVAFGIRTPQRLRPAWYRDSRSSGRGHS
jgi:hypothetical protein